MFSSGRILIARAIMALILFEVLMSLLLFRVFLNKDDNDDDDEMAMI